MEWVREGTSLPPGSADDADAVRAWRPWVLEEDSRLRMWYAGHDGTTWRILEAVAEDGAWERRGVVIEPGLAGETDDFGVQDPCVIRTRGGYLMVYSGLDGEVTRLHMASSLDGHDWSSLGTFLQRGEEDREGASHASILTVGTRWWLFFSAYEGTGPERRASILAAISDNGASWDRLGPVLAPQGDEVAAAHPCVIDHELEFHMFYAHDDGARSGIALATSKDGINWDRRGIVLPPMGEGPDGLAADTPCVVRLADGTMRMWYAGLPLEDTQHAYRICSARFEGELSR